MRRCFVTEISGLSATKPRCATVQKSQGLNYARRGASPNLA